MAKFFVGFGMIFFGAVLGFVFSMSEQGTTWMVGGIIVLWCAKD